MITKGKWKLMPCRERAGNLDIVVDTPCESGTFLGIIACCSKRNSKPAEVEANARLIAAAPKLLEALKESRKRLVFLHQAIRGETKPIFDDIEIRKTGSCIIFIDEAIAEAEAI